MSIDLWTSVATVIDFAVLCATDLLYTVEVEDKSLILQEYDVK